MATLARSAPILHQLSESERRNPPPWPIMSPRPGQALWPWNLAWYCSTDPQPSGGAVPPSGAFAAAIAASAVAGSQLHERPKCIFGWSPAGFAPETAGARRMTEETADMHLRTGYDYGWANASSGAEAYDYQDATRGDRLSSQCLTTQFPNECFNFILTTPPLFDTPYPFHFTLVHNQLSDLFSPCIAFAIRLSWKMLCLNSHFSPSPCFWCLILLLFLFFNFRCLFFCVNKARKLHRYFSFIGLVEPRFDFLNRHYLKFSSVLNPSNLVTVCKATAVDWCLLNNNLNWWSTCRAGQCFVGFFSLDRKLGMTWHCLSPWLGS